jgi:hypothetical protein
MTAWRRFWTLGAADRFLITEAAALLVAIQLGLMVFRYPTLRRVLTRCVPKGNSSARVERVAWAVSVAAVRLPFRIGCLVRALAADVMLRRRGHAPELRLGVRLAATSSTGLEAHAWIDLHGVVLIGQLIDRNEFVEMAPPGVA